MAPAQVTCHTFRATGITTYFENDGDLETAQHIAGYASANTTRIYDHRDQKLEQEEIERLGFDSLALEHLPISVAAPGVVRTPEQ